MSRKYQLVPQNRKTLFLRNLEFLLLDYKYIGDEDIKVFRSNLSQEILNLLDEFVSDESDDTNEKLLSTYQLHSNFMRFLGDRKRLSN